LGKQWLRPIKYRLREGRFLKNVNKRSANSPRVLLSYTVIPFLTKGQSHTNRQESQVIVDVFDELGYKVDVIHYANQKKINYSGYDLVFGFGEPFESSFKDSRCKATRIYYATGAHVLHQNPAEALRVQAFNQKYKAKLLPKRLVPWCWTMSTTFSDYLIVIGNDWTTSTYKKFTDKPVWPINATALMNPRLKSIQRQTSKAKKNFLWFGSAGLVHKGLDLCLEYFSLHPEYTLHICGPKELEFFEAMQPFLSKPNIIYHGFVDVSSEQFIEITSSSLFAILPSCSEGQATALLTAMSAGLIPVASRYTGVDVEQYGYLIEALDVDAISSTLQSIGQISDNQLEKQSSNCMDYIEQMHSLDAYRNNLSVLLSKCINEV